MMQPNQAPRIIIKDATRDSTIWRDIKLRPTDIIICRRCGRARDASLIKIRCLREDVV